jgi:NAD(P)-dependent dehydrogenase (short-subunit alcohol dehydrogenase family)
MTHTAIITGASRGLGLALARALARRHWNLIINARETTALEQARNELAQYTKVTAIAGDISDESHARTLVDAVPEFGGLHALINNASTLGPSPQPNLTAYPLGALEQVYRINVFAPLRLIQLAADSFKAQARIINISSDAGIEGYAGWGGYGSSKAALEQLSRVLAAEHPEWRVYWVDPGDMRTQMHQEAFPGEDISDRPEPEVSVPGLLSLLEGNAPSGRYRAQTMPEVTA